MTIDALLQRYDVDIPHARHVADQALALFDEAKRAHGLPRKARHLLEIGALLHNVGLNIDQPLHHIIGRDIVLDVGLAHLANLDDDERAVVACLVAFHRKKVRPRLEPAYLRLGKKDQQTALRLAALLRVADGLDYTGTQTTRLHTCKIGDSEVLLRLAGPDAEENGARALKKADLWRKVLGSQVTVDVATSAATDGATAGVGASVAAAGVLANVAPNVGQTLLADDPRAGAPAASTMRLAAAAFQPAQTTTDTLAELGRRLLRNYFQKFLAQEDGVRADKDPEAVHDMRVATRRMRAVLQTIAGVAPTDQVRHFRRELQRAARTLSPVRDGDVLLLHLASYRAALPEDARSGADALVTAVERERQAGRAALLDYFASERYATFQREFAAFMTDEAKGWRRTLRVRDLAGSIIWQRYEALRAYETHIDPEGDQSSQIEALHQARIEGKRLRYVLEMFDEPLQGQASHCIAPIAALQEQLGTLQDIAVATDYVGRLDLDAPTQPAAEAYLASRDAAGAHLFSGSFPGCWRHLLSETYRRDLTHLLLAL